jgi:YesN/AraC family two-component response regulator
MGRNDSEERINVLVVDDNITVLKGIVTGVDFDQLEVECVRMATGANEARTIMSQMPIHILLCDIEMPGEDGISLVKWVNENYPAVICIFLTSHDSFTYAQQGVKLGCFDFVIQPAPYQEIEVVVKRAIQKLKLQKMQDEMYHFGKYLLKNKQDMFERIIKDLISDQEYCRNRGIHDLGEMETGIDDNSIVFPAMIDVIVKKDKREETGGALVEFIIYNILSELMEEKNIKTINTTASPYSCWVLLYSAEQTEVDFKLVSEKFVDYMETYFHMDTICYLGKQVKVSQLYLDAQNILQVRNNNVSQQKKIYSIQDIQVPAQTHHLDLSYRINRWENMLRNHHENLVHHEIFSYIDSLVGNAKANVDNLCFLHQQLTQMFFSILSEQNTEVSNIFSDQYTYQDYMDSYKKEDWLKTAIGMMTEAIKQKSTTEMQDDNLINKARIYISNNISQELSVKMVSSYVNLSTPYLTKIFKQQTGSSPKNYILQEKIEIAKELLESTSLSISLVALQIGYTNFSHFTQIFKKMVKVTPVEYRKLNTKNPLLLTKIEK